MKRLIALLLSLGYRLHNRILLRYRNVQTKGKLTIYGKIKIYGHGQITIGDGVTINSSLSSNPIGGDTHTVLSVNPGAVLTIGDGVGISNSAIVCHERVTIGDGTLLGGSVKIYDTDFHSLDWRVRGDYAHEQAVTKPVTVGAHVFIGAHSIILKGVTIGDRSIVGAGSVVTKDIGPDEVWAGNPARKIRSLEEGWKMRILWVCNIMLPEAAEALGREAPAVGGWMSGLLHSLLKLSDGEQEGGPFELAVCFPVCGEDPVQGEAAGFSFYSFRQKALVLNTYDPDVERQLKEIMEQVKPDLVHIFGTEYVHTLAAVKAFGHPERTVIGIQGMARIYARHFTAGEPERIQRGCTFRDIVKRDNLRHQRKSFLARAAFEEEAIRTAGHVIGRTDWDRACTGQIHPDVNYHVCNEILRDSFYEARWKYENCEPYSLFVSQGSYPIKGLHYVLEAMPLILARFPEAKLYVAGGDITCDAGFKDRLRRTSYGKYVKELTERYGLQGKVIFTGFLSEGAMRDRYLKSHVFVSPSSIENSPNSVGEAMLLGMPVVASDVGGVKNLLNHGTEGYVYPADEAYMLAYYVCCLFEDPNKAAQMGTAAAQHAALTHNRKANGERMLAIYKEIWESADETIRN